MARGSFRQVVADIDGDGDDDVILIDAAAKTITILKSAGGFTFVRGGQLGPDPGFAAATTVDLDQDGDLDLAALATTPSSRVYVYENSGDGVFDSPLWSAANHEGAETIESADMDGDGLPDIVTSGNGHLSVLRNPSAPTSRDCNQNGSPDECDIAAGTSFDDDGDGVPDECAPRFHRGDPNQSGVIDLSDAIFIFGFLFLGGGAPADPGGPSRPCGRDPDAYGSSGSLGCEAYEGC